MANKVTVNKVTVKESVCEECHGTGVLTSFNGVFTDVEDCEYCGGNGVQPKSEVATLLEEINSKRLIIRELVFDKTRAEEEIKNLKEELDETLKALALITAKLEVQNRREDALEGIVFRMRRVIMDASQIL